MKRFKQCLSAMMTLCMLLSSGCLVVAAETETTILLSDSGVTVDGSGISKNTTSAVYLSERTESHADVAEDLKSVVNQVITITQAGTYRISGAMTDTQLVVDAGDTAEVTLILDGVALTCRTAPAILIRSAKEPAMPGTSGVTLSLAEESKNTIQGSHTLATDDDAIKHDAAISSNVSLTIDGSGSLDVIADNEGIEVKYKHLTINNGTLHIDSCDDPINGSEDGVAHITINGGYLYCTTEYGAEGDGIDSNGYITINGGTVIALANPNSMDSGLDSDFGTTINGGVVVGAGNMYDRLEEDGNQPFMYLQFSAATDDIICVLDETGTPVFAYDFPNPYSYISFSSPSLQEGVYHVYTGGTVSGTMLDGLYTNITGYSGGTQLHHGGTPAMGNPGGPGRPEDGRRPDGNRPERPQPPEGMEFPKFPDGAEFPERPEGTPPDGFGGRRPGGMQSSAQEATYNFHLTKTTNGFTNVTAGDIQHTEKFDDVPADAWFYAAVTRAAQENWMIGVSDNQFAPDEPITGAQWITILARLANADVKNGETWYTGAVNWGLQQGIIQQDDWNFEPDASLTREQMADIIWRFAKAQQMDVSATEDLSIFADHAEISDFAQEAFSWAIAAEILQGDGSALHPGDTLTRAEAAQVASNLHFATAEK